MGRLTGMHRVLECTVLNVKIKVRLNDFNLVCLSISFCLYTLIIFIILTTKPG